MGGEYLEVYDFLYLQKKYSFSHFYLTMLPFSVSLLSHFTLTSAVKKAEWMPGGTRLGFSVGHHREGGSSGDVADWRGAEAATYLEPILPYRIQAEHFQMC